MAETASLPPPTPLPSIKAQPIIQAQLRPLRDTPRRSFDPSTHLRYVSPPNTLSMKDLGLPEAGISPLGCSEPFPLFSDEAMHIMRSEIFTNEVWDNCLQSTALAACQLRGHCPR